MQQSPSQPTTKTQEEYGRYGLTIVLINPGLKVRSCGRREHPLPWLRLRRCLVLPSAYEDSNRIVLVQ